MFLYIFLCSTLIVTSVQCENSTLSERVHNSNVNKTTNGAETGLLHKTKLPVFSEGGTLLPNTPDLSLPKQHENSLLSLEEESVKTKEKTVVARKGVDINPTGNNTDATSAQSNSNNSTLISLQKNKTDSINYSSIIPVKSKDIHINTVLNKTVELTDVNKTKVLKPKILSFEALANFDKKIQSNLSKIPIAPSTKIMPSSQIPSPNAESIVKVYPSKANNSHPGMIMPIVITILVVPMFAIVGYMALRRGQEAWKNRHYKRMDFLLDGMYND